MLTIFGFVFFFHSFIAGLFTFIFALFGIWIASSALMKMRGQKIEEEDLNEKLGSAVKHTIDTIFISDKNNISDVTIIDNTDDKDN